MKNFKLKSYCKINLFLRVVCKLKNNYHNIKSLITWLYLHDVISIKKSSTNKDKINFSGRFKFGISNEFNTVTKLLDLLRKNNYLKKEKFEINIQKNIPHGSGLGGGSSNAADLLNYFNLNMKLKLSEKKKNSIAKKIGFVLLIRDERESIHSSKLTRYNTLTGTYYLPKYAFQDVIKKEIIKNRIFDEYVFNLSKEYIKPDSIVIDAGANYGQMSILYSKLYNDVEVYSFEASKYIYDILVKNVELNSKNIKTIHCALSDVTDEKYLAAPNLKKYGTYGSLDLELSNNNNNGNDKILIRQIDDFDFKKKISFMKVDVQGWDLKVLNGSINTIKKNRMPIIFEYEQVLERKMNYTLDDFINFFKRIDYKFITSENNNFLVIPVEFK